MMPRNPKVTLEAEADPAYGLALADSMRAVSNQPKTPHRTVRVPDEVWLPAKVKAETEGSNLSVKIREFLIWYAETGASVEQALAAAQSSALTVTADLVHDATEGLPFDSDYDRAIVATWLMERAEDIAREHSHD